MPNPYDEHRIRPIRFNLNSEDLTKAQQKQICDQFFGKDQAKDIAAEWGEFEETTDEDGFSDYMSDGKEA